MTAYVYSILFQNAYYHDYSGQLTSFSICVLYQKVIVTTLLLACIQAPYRLWQHVLTSMTRGTFRDLLTTLQIYQVDCIEVLFN